MPLNLADPKQWLNILWLFWLLLWMAAAFTAKRTRTAEPRVSRALYLIPVVFAGLLLFSHSFRFPPFTDRFVPQSVPLEWMGAVMTGLGIAFTVWARFHIGRNWSGQVVIKQGHELIRSGPYALVRHPIYTGLLLALAGTGLTIGEVRAILALALAAFHFIQKAEREEGFMLQEFGEAYARYRSKTGMLLPRLR